ITNVQDQALHLQHNNDNLTYTGYNPLTTKIVQANYFEYYLKTDNANGVYQLMFYDGSGNPDVPVVDNVVGLNFDYYGDPQAAMAALRGPASALFTHGGTSNGGSKWVPDQEIRFMVSPRNLNLGR